MRAPVREFESRPLRITLAQVYHITYFFLAHLVLAAFLAIILRLLALSFAALALPPLEAPNLPKITAAGCFLSATACRKIEAAIWLMSGFLLARLSIGLG